MLSALCVELERFRLSENRFLRLNVLGGLASGNGVGPCSTDSSDVALGVVGLSWILSEIGEGGGEGISG